MSNEQKVSKTPKAPKVKFFDGVKAEFKKIIWPDKDTLTKETVVVVVSTVILGIVIAALDLIIKFGLNIVLG
mgnify:FL=1